MVRRIFFLFNIAAVMALLMQGGFFQNGQASVPLTVEGTFLVVWGDGVSGSSDTQITYFLSTQQYEIIQLIINEELLTSVGGSIGLNRKPVILQGMWKEPGKVMLVQTITMADGQQVTPQGVYGPQPWVSIMCKFKDYPDEPNNLQYFRDMYSMEYPGLDHFWRQNSYDLANLEGSFAYGWYELPQNRDYYVYNDQLDFGRAAEDCTAVADADVYYPDYVGINLMFNYTLDCCAWGGAWQLNRDGHNQVWRMTWEPPWGYQNIGVIAHETGHGFGLPHSLGNCQNGYDNRWDVLSDVWSNGSDPIWGTMGQHTISYHKELVEWIKPDKLFISNTGTIETIAIERLALPKVDNYLGARILINNSPQHFYTLEVRQPTDNLIDYDKWLPGFAVIIHDVEVNRNEPAIVIDQDGDCNTGDAGAMYTQGEVFTDMANGITVSIEQATDSGYVVTINNRYTVVESVEITGPTQGNLGQSVPFTATVSPEEAATPITYTWEATGLPPVQHNGDSSGSPLNSPGRKQGTKAITVTASNAGGSVVDTHLIEIDKKVPIVSVTGPINSSVGVMNVYTATVTPDDVVLPITYTWQASGQPTITHTMGLSDTASFAWEYPGTQVITVTAENVEGLSSDTISVDVMMPPLSMEVIGLGSG